MSDKTTVVIGCTTTRDYNFLLPLSCLLWRDRIGYDPLALLVGTEEDWCALPYATVALEALRHHNIQNRFIGLAEGYPEHTTAQNCRQHAAALKDIDPSTWIMPADADLWPLRREFYHQHEGTRYKLVCYYGNGDHFEAGGGKNAVLTRAAHGLGAQTIPTCHAVMRAKDWRSIYGLQLDDVAGSIKRTIDGWLPSRKPSPSYDANMFLWMSDQQIMTEALCQQFWFPADVRMIERRGHPPIDRLDRGAWQGGAFEVSKWTDAHVHRNPDEEAHWKDELEILQVVLPQHVEWAQKYRDAYASAK